MPRSGTRDVFSEMNILEQEAGDFLYKSIATRGFRIVVLDWNGVGRAGWGSKHGLSEMERGKIVQKFAGTHGISRNDITFTCFNIIRVLYSNYLAKYTVSILHIWETVLYYQYFTKGLFSKIKRSRPDDRKSNTTTCYGICGTNPV